MDKKHIIRGRKPTVGQYIFKGKTLCFYDLNNHQAHCPTAIDLFYHGIIDRLTTQTVPRLSFTPNCSINKPKMSISTLIH